MMTLTIKLVTGTRIQPILNTCGNDMGFRTSVTSENFSLPCVRKGNVRNPDGLVASGLAILARRLIVAKLSSDSGCRRCVWKEVLEPSGALPKPPMALA